MPRTKTYAGIGSRETPIEIQNKMTEIASRLSQLGYTLYSGGAEGADHAFELGAAQKIIFLPWEGFNQRKADGCEYVVPSKNLDLVKRFHPKPSSLSSGGLLLMSRNTYQVLGPDLQSPVDFVLCWTKDGKASGGTGQAIRIAKHHNIPVFNLKNGYEGFAKFMVMKNLLDM
jgi:hypothetical protein